MQSGSAELEETVGDVGQKGLHLMTMVTTRTVQETMQKIIRTPLISCTLDSFMTKY